MNRKYLKKAFRYIITISFITFLALYTSQTTGYVEYQNKKQAILTEKQIQKFEDDIAQGKQIDIEEYLKTNDKDYQNAISKLGLKISQNTKKTVNTIVETSFKILSDLAQ